MRIEVLNTPIDNVTRKQALETLVEFLNTNENHIVITPNPEMIMEAQRDKEFLDIIRKTDLIIPDGTGVVLASWLGKNKLKERVTGCDLSEALFERIAGKDYTVYLFGAAKGVAEKAKENMEKKYPGLKIVGTHDGYFDVKEEKLVIKEIQRLRPDVLLVGSSFPKGEKLIYRHKKRLPVKISMAVGGSIDIMAGKVKRAPKAFRVFGLEWFCRLLSQPSRFNRILNIPVFVFKVLKDFMAKNITRRK